MATKEQIEYIAEELPKAHPTNLFKGIDDSNAGIGFVLKLLNTADGNRLSAGEISDSMCVSTARVAVILKKMERKGLIFRERDKTDTRVTIVRLSEEGRKTAEETRKHMLDHISDIIDKLGMEKLERFITLSREIKAEIGEEFPPQNKT